MHYPTTTAALHQAIRTADNTNRPAHVMHATNGQDGFEVWGEATRLVLMKGPDPVITGEQFARLHHQTIYPRVRRDYGRKAG